MPPLGRFRGEAGAQFEIAGVKERAGFGFEEKLCRTKDVARGQKHEVETAHCCRLTEGDDVLVAFAGEPRLHQARSPFGNDDFLMRGDVIAMRMRNEGERFRVPRVEPKLLRREVKAARKSDINHSVNFTRLALVCDVPRALTPSIRARLLAR